MVQAMGMAGQKGPKKKLVRLKDYLNHIFDINYEKSIQDKIVDQCEQFTFSMSQLSMGIKIAESKAPPAEAKSGEKKKETPEKEDEEVITPKQGLQEKIERMKSKQSDFKQEEEIVVVEPVDAKKVTHNHDHKRKPRVPRQSELNQERQNKKKKA